MVGHQNGDSESDNRSGNGYNGQDFEIQFLLKLIALDDIESIDEQNDALHSQNITQQWNIVESCNCWSGEVKNSI